MPIDFRKTSFIGVAANLKQCPPPTKPEIVFSGRSNVGKSTLINILADNRKLARTSMTPGKTRLIIYFDVDGRLLLTDLPGYGYARAPRHEKEAFASLADSYLTSDRPISMILLLLDIRHKPNKHDLMMLDWLREAGIENRIVLTKADKLSRSKQMIRKKELARELSISDLGKIMVVSSMDKSTVQQLRDSIAAHLQDTAKSV